MTLAERLDNIRKTSLTHLHGAVQEHLKEEARQLSERNTLLLNVDQTKAEAEEELKRHSKEVEIVNFIGAQAVAQKMSVDTYMKHMPPDFRELYQAARKKINLFLTAMQDPEELTMTIHATALRNKIMLYVPVLYKERQKLFLPAVIYGTAIMATSQTVSDLHGMAEDPRNVNDIIMQIVDVDGARGAERLEHYLAREDLSALKRKGVSVVAHVSHWRDDVIELSGRRRPRKERKIAERKQPAAESSLETAIPKPGEQVYTLTEAARLWREHEVKTGEVNGNEQNYLMKLGARAEEGRILKTADGKIPESSLDDFLFYMNARRQIYSSKKTGPTKLPVSQAADILRTDAATIEKLVGEGKLIKDGYDKVSIYSIEKFTRRHTYRNGEWVDFTNQKPHNLRQAEKRIKGGRSDYLSAKEAADLYKVSSITILNWARKGEFQTYYDKKPTKFLFSKQDLEKFMKDRSK